MRLRVTRFLGWLVFFLSLCSLVAIGVAVDPYSLNQVGIALVAGIFLLMVASLMWSCLVSLGVRFLGEERTEVYQASAVRQSVLVAALVTAFLIALSMRVLTWWGILLALVLVLLIELTWRRFQLFKR